MKMDMKEIKKACLTGKIDLSDHAVQRMDKRGYIENDVVQCIMTGQIKERQVYRGKPTVIIAGEDLDGLPIIVAVGTSSKKNHYIVITVMPPIDKERFDRVI
ncbi:DUF4258 domain-containing protein [Cytobacillus gottheilii]|uniref:DUF4258 domain-containing protein n=1 Tax=Cytobacillus gottheilii TaxID=859144 RepID=UPI0024943F38|nr:DUF4258 domain-containing protein [Cytobacillus gottheilii]